MSEQKQISVGLEPSANISTSATSTPPILRDVIGGLWTLPSDHLPIGAKIGDIAVASWNVLNTAYMRYIRDDQQGLASSRITSEDRPSSSGSTITVREQSCIEMVRRMCGQFDVVALQECSANFLRELASQMPSNWQLLTGRSSKSENDICMLWNTATITIDRASSTTVEAAYPRCIAASPSMQRPIMNVGFATTSGQELRIIHSHVPGDPKLPGTEEIVEYTKGFSSGSGQVLLVGDLNFPHETVEAECVRQGLPPFENLNSLATILGNDGTPKRIDHMMLFGNGPTASAIATAAFGAEAVVTAALLNRV